MDLIKIMKLNITILEIILFKIKVSGQNFSIYVLSLSKTSKHSLVI